MSDAFDDWMIVVDDVLIDLAGVVSDDLPDQSWRDWFDAGMSSNAAARRARRAFIGLT